MVSLSQVVAGVVVLAMVLPLTAYFFPPSAVRKSLRAFERQSGVPASHSAAVIAFATAFVLAIVVAVDGVGIVEGVGAALGVFGPLFVAAGLASRPAHQQFAAASDATTGSPPSGLVAVEGRAMAVDDPIVLPGDDKAVTCAYVLQRARETIRSPVWQTLAEGERTVPLGVDDGSGPVRVDTESVTVRSTTQAGTGSTRIDLPEDEPVPDDVAAFLRSVGVDSPDTPDADHRLKLRTIAPGQPVTAVGTHERITREDDAFWGLTAGDGPAYLFRGEREAVRTRLRREVRLLGPIGVVLTLLGVAYLASLFGLL